MHVDISLQHVPVISYAMAHNRIPVIFELELRSHLDAPGAQVHLTIGDDDGPLTRDTPWLVDLVAGAITRLDRPAVPLDPARLLQNKTRRPGWIDVEIRHADEVLGRARKDVELLPGAHWLSVPRGLAEDLLAAHVLPHDPAIGALLAEAATHLGQVTGDPSLQGYQDGPERVDAIVEAIWATAQQRQIRYTLPPASWSEAGQQVRTPMEVLEGRSGTCLDTTVVLAAALEAAGIRPLLWVLEGHALLAYWRHEFALDAVTYDDAAEVMNEVDLDRIRLIETTAVCDGERRTSLHEATAMAHRRLTDLRVVEAVVDVWTARRCSILPLPARRLADGVVQIIEYHASAAPADIVISGRNAAVAPDSSAVPARVRQWKNALLDLSLRNRLIKYADKQGVRLLTDPHKLGVLEDLISAGQSLHLRPADAIESIDVGRGITDATALPPERLASLLAESRSIFADLRSDAYLSRLRSLAHKARTIEEESGANNLYLALGSLTWRIDAQELRSPLILIPVRLISGGRGQRAYRLQLDESGASTPNFCLLEKLKAQDHLDIPELAEPVTDQSGIDLDRTFRAVREAIAARGLRYRVEPTADLAILQFAKFRLWKDLDEHWEEMLANPLVRHLVETPTLPFDDPAPVPPAVDLDELDAACPVPADASQLEAIAEAVGGRTFVLEGPPGTGKSQTITNLLTRAVADGKRVLFVAEKRAALDVVASRLAAVGMAPFALDLHDKGAKPALVRAQIKRALEHNVTVDTQGFDADQEDLRTSRKSLDRYARRLHEANTAGLSYYSAHTALLARGTDGPTLPVPRSVLGANGKLDHVRSALRKLPESADLARPRPDHAWGFVTAAPPDEDARHTTAQALLGAARAFDTALEALARTSVAAAIQAVTQPNELDHLASLVSGPVPLGILDAVATPAWQETTAAVQRDIDGLLAAHSSTFQAVTLAALDLPLAELTQAAQAADDANFLVRGKRRRAVAERLTAVLQPGAHLEPDQVGSLLATLTHAAAATQDLRARLAALPGFRLPSTWSPFHDDGALMVRQQRDWLIWTALAVTDEHNPPLVAAVRHWLSGSPTQDPDAATACQGAAAVWREIAASSAVTADGIGTWTGTSTFVAQWGATRDHRDLAPDATQLHRWLTFQSDLGPLRAAGLTEAAQSLSSGALLADDAVSAFERGLAHASLEERRTATGLDGFDPTAHDRVVTRFTRSAEAVRDHMPRTVPAEILKARDINTESGRGLVGELRREASRQRGGLGVRGLMHRYGSLVTKLMPCVLVSPDSVSRFFPVGGTTFDLVVFDEASQIRVADAIGAMGRAHSVVVVGDSKQMPPTSIAETAAGGDDLASAEFDSLIEEESILSEAVNAQVPQRWLTWHYRSRDESLIAFSNDRYYESRLSSFPAPTHNVTDRLLAGYGLSLVRVDGTFQRSGKGRLLRTNPIEAEAIVAELRRQFAASPERVPSIGVVTFNQQQRTYIEDLIRDEGDDRLVEALDGRNGEGLFIKNLENVQGDERDVILFSTAFSVNDRGVLPLNFGPLTRAGGERRLNVAITRARRQVIIYSSFDPGQIRAEETQSTGIRHLREYLELAAAGRRPEGSARPGAVADRHRDAVAAALRESGVVVQTDVGMSDFRVDLAIASPDAPDDPLVAVLLDGPGWAARRTVGDRDGLPVAVLHHLMRWPAVERVWLPGWLRDPDTVVARLLDSLASAEATGKREEIAVSFAEETHDLLDEATFDLSDEPMELAGRSRDSSATLSAPATPDAPAPVPSTARQSAAQDHFRAFTPRFVATREVLDALPGSSATARVRSVLAEIIEAEGPIQLERLAKLAAACFDLTRVRQDRVDAILAALPASAVPDRSDPFAWPPGRDPKSWRGFRAAAPGEQRDLDEVSLVEIGNAMAAVTAEAHGMSTSDLASETVAVFGGRRRTASITARLDAARQRALADGRLAADGDLITATTAPASTGPTSPTASTGIAEEPTDALAAAVISSGAFRRQRELVARTAVTDQAVVRLLTELMANPARRLSTTAAGAALGVPIYQARGALSQTQQLLNIDGYAVLSVDSDGDTVLLDEGLLREQFELRRSAPEAAGAPLAGGRTD